MTYEEIVERVRKKSSICSECGCFISSLLDCCPACGWRAEKNISATDSYIRDSLAESYRALGGNSVVEKIAVQDARTSSYITSLYEKHSKEVSENLDAARSYITCIPSSSQLGDIKGLPGQVLYCADTDRCYVYYKDYQWQQLYDHIPDIGRPVTLYKDNEPFATEYVPDVDYTSYYKAKTDALQAQQRTMRLYEDAIKAMKSYSGNKIALDILEEEIERVKDHYL